MQLVVGGGVIVVGTTTGEPSVNTPDLHVLIGSPDFVKDRRHQQHAAGATFSTDPQQRVTVAQARGHTVIAVNVNGVPCGLVHIEDSLKPEAAAVVATLKRDGRTAYMVTGDSELAARAMARRAGISPSNVFAQQLPQHKAALVMQLQDDGKTVAFVGDGINDSAALAQAHVGIALGAGTEVAIDSADVVLINSALTDTLLFFELSAVTMRRIYANFVWAVCYNLLMLPVASGVLFPLIKRQLPPVLAGIAMVCSSLSVLASSLALNCFTPSKPVQPSTAAGDDDARDTTSLLTSREEVQVN